MDHLLRSRIWPPFLASSGVGPCDVPFRYANQHPAVARLHAHLCDLATAIHEISGLAVNHAIVKAICMPAQRSYFFLVNSDI
jgi:hypothetical protein